MNQLESLLLAHPEGLIKAEIARRLGIHRSTAGRYIDELSLSVSIWEDEKTIKIDRDNYLHNIRLNIHEAMSLHIAARLMGLWLDKHNRHAASAIRKLGLSIQRSAATLSRQIIATADSLDREGQKKDLVFISVLEILTRAWSLNKRVRLEHYSLRRKKTTTYNFAPYFIEPYMAGKTIHVIGSALETDHLWTFRIDRILRAALLSESYSIPKTFDTPSYLANAWGIWSTEAKPVTVRLNFSKEVAYRVKETRWHKNQRIETQPDGSLRWQATIAEPLEMLPWIRGWGKDVVILEPEELKDRFKQELLILSLIYGVEGITDIKRGN